MYLPIKLRRDSAVNEKNAERYVIGRDNDVKNLWNTLKSGSVRVLAERRMGKTWMLHLAIAKKPDWAIPFFLDVENFKSSQEFVWNLNRGLYRNNLVSKKHFNFVNKWFSAIRRLFQRVQKQDLGKVIIPELDTWENLLQDTIENFVKANKEKISVLIIDELPFFLDKLIKSDNIDDAIQVLDTFRAIRDANPSLRMIFCGSLGLHVVLSKLRDQGYTGRPFNNMPPFEVPPLDKEKACYLSGCLLIGQDIACSNPDEVARAVSEAGCGVPYYIQNIVKWMEEKKSETWDPEKTLSIPESWFESGIDPADLSYYDERLDMYYPEDMRDKARAILNVLSSNKEGLTLDKIINLIRYHPNTMTCDAKQVSQVVDTLQKDHYITMKKDVYGFKLEIVRKWWWNKMGRYGI